MSQILSAPNSAVFHAGRIKKYPDGNCEVLVCNRPIFCNPGWELHGGDRALAALAKAKRSEAARAAEEAAQISEGEAEELCATGAGSNQANIDRAARRAAARLRDLALCNDFKWFVTLTLDPARIDRYDVAAITRRLNTWLDNQVRRRGLKYVLVPERHKDGALHFHGFVNDVDGMTPSGTWKVPGHQKPIRPRSHRQAVSWAEAGYQEVFNWDAWSLGFTTAIQLYGEYSAAVAYVCKYIRKQTDGGKIGGRWYYSGGALNEPEKLLVDVGLSELQNNPKLYTFEIPEARLCFGIWRGKFSDFEAEFTKAGLSNPAGIAEGEGPPPPRTPENNRRD